MYHRFIIHECQLVLHQVSKPEEGRKNSCPWFQYFQLFFLASVHRTAASQSSYGCTTSSAESWTIIALCVFAVENNNYCESDSEYVQHTLQLSLVNSAHCVCVCVCEEENWVYFLRQFHIALNAACNHSDVEAQKRDRDFKRLRRVFREGWVYPSGCDKLTHTATSNTFPLHTHTVYYESKSLNNMEDAYKQGWNQSNALVDSIISNLTEN